MGKKGRKAWVVTWKWAGDHARRDDALVAVFPPQWSGEKVREHVQTLHLMVEMTPPERINYALNPKLNPYPAQFGSVEGNIPWTGEIWCGYNPWLYACLVDDLRIDEHGRTTWEDRPRPKLPKGFSR